MRRLAAAVLVLSGCGSGSDAPHPDAAPDADTSDAAIDGPTPVAERQLDLLLVIENSPAMADMQMNLLANYPNITNVLGIANGGLGNLHIAVVTTDLGTNGAADSQPGSSIGVGAGACSGYGDAGTFHGSSKVTGGYIVDVANTDGSRTRNYTGDLNTAFDSIANVGASGCAFPQPLEAAKRALSSPVGANQGFLRDGATLAILFVSASDDCSLAHSTLLGPDTTTLGPLMPFRCNRFGHVCAVGGTDSSYMNQPGTKDQCTSNEASAYLTPVADYVTYFKGLKSDPDKLLVTAIAGPTTPYEVEARTPPGGSTAYPAVAHSCSFVASGPTTIVADPDVRIRQFLDGFQNHYAYATICQQDLSGPIYQIDQYVFGP